MMFLNTPEHNLHEFQVSQTGLFRRLSLRFKPISQLLRRFLLQKRHKHLRQKFTFLVHKTVSHAELCSDVRVFPKRSGV